MSDLTNDQINIIFFSIQTEEQQHENRARIQQDSARFAMVLNESRESFKNLQIERKTS